MRKGYFHEVHDRFGTEFWVNNASLSEIQLGLEGGAVGIASNPSYISTLLKTEPEFVHETVDAIVGHASADTDEEVLAMQVIQKTVSRPLGMFHEMYKQTDGRYGHVAIQGSPRKNHDLSAMLEEADVFHEMGENIIIKQPSTVEGAKMLEELTARGWSTIGTMCFSVSQYIYMAEAYHRGLKRTDKNPKCLITTLPGMFEEYLAEDAEKRGVEVSPDIISQAWVSAARAAYKVYRERNYKAIILAGGARFTRHWTELVGPEFAMTLSGALAETLIEEHPDVVNRMDTPAPQAVIKELRDKFPDFVRACDEGAMVPEEFRPYGPVVRFQNSLSKGFDTIIEQIQSKQPV